MTLAWQMIRLCRDVRYNARSNNPHPKCNATRNREATLPKGSRYSVEADEPDGGVRIDADGVGVSLHPSEFETWQPKHETPGLFGETPAAERETEGVLVP